MTNDIEKLASSEQRSMFCMFLNTQGRVLFDALIYRGPDTHEYLLDVDSRVSSVARKHLSMYIVKRKVKLELSDKTRVLAAFPAHYPPDNPATLHLSTLIPNTDLCYSDPRVSALGSRLLLENTENVDNHIPGDTEHVDEVQYHHHRCVLGVAEGWAEYGLGKVTPLEYNLDHMNGVSFDKGCYIGQELTARTHHTGVIRKRILPLTINPGELSTPDSESEITVMNEKNKNVGKIKRVINNVGLGLMRLKETFESESLTVNNVHIVASKPSWWPTNSK